MQVAGAVRAIARSRPVTRAAAMVLRPVLRQFSLEQITGSWILSAAVRTPIDVPWFSIRIPGGATLIFSSAWAPYLYWGGAGAFEPDLVPSFLARLGSARSFVDVGANFGFYSMLAARTNAELEVQAVEPNPEVAAVLRETAARNGVDFTIHEVALSDCAGTAPLSLRGGLSSLLESRWEDDEIFHLATTARFDDLFPGGADLVKIDVEGAEARVLAGMEETIRRNRPTILCEVGKENAVAVCDFAQRHDYRILALPGERPVEEIDVVHDSVNVVLEPRV